ncbi:MAG: hypothetical protein JSS91_13455 [Bacteroidetes bacterium]|nr:hypothetical protein [Bacteroidota bacterium]
MNTLFKKATAILTISVMTILSFCLHSEESKNGSEISTEDLAPYKTEKENQIFKKETTALEGPEGEKKYFERWHYPYGAVLPEELIENMWTEINSMPEETQSGDAVTNSWRMIGPYGSVNVNSGARFSGRMLDIEVGNTVNPLLATASGGLWGYIGYLPVCASNDVTSLAVSTVASNPADPSTILIGTGEYLIRKGTGLWRTTNSGVEWTHINISPNPGDFYRIRHQIFFADVVHAVTTKGYYRSIDGGLNWVKHLNGIGEKGITDIAVNPNNPNIIYCCKHSDGIYKSTNNGVNWAKVTTPGIPTTDVGRASVTIGTSNSNKIYVMIDSQAGDTLKGIYMSANEGATWTDVSPPENIFGNQGWYNNVIGVCPTNSNIILAGGVRLWRSINSGSTWTKITDDDVHADIHAIEWTSDGNSVYIGTDGGVMKSDDQGVTFTSGLNYIPVTQYVNFDVGESNRGVIYGGSQDNGLTGTTDGGQSWIHSKAGDGGGVAVDPISALNVYATGGAYKGNYPFYIFKSTDKGLSWDTNHTGIEPFTNWYTKMRSDRTNPLKLYTNAGNYVYESVNEGLSWNKLNIIPLPAVVADIGVSKYVFPKAVIYAALDSDLPGQKLRVYDGGSFVERSSGLPNGYKIRTVVPHQTNTSIAYALIDGISAGNKVFKTTNKGVNWTNISGNLPNIPVGGLVPDRLFGNKLYLGTEMGCYRTTNSGVSWHRWNNGMPDAVIVTEMKWIDSTLENGKKYVIASTYGRSFWVREVSGDDPENVLDLTVFIQGFYNTGTSRTVPDTVRAYLRNNNSPYSVVDSGKGKIGTSGKTSMIFENAFPDNDYYIQIKHRNSIETWSYSTINFNDPTINYDFTISQANAYGNNQILVNQSTMKYAIYNGDVNQDGTVDLSDGSMIDNDGFNFVSGYVSTDVNGDDLVDLSDASLVDNNTFNFVSKITP